MPKLPDAHRILLIDDNAAIHGDFRKVLGAEAEDAAQAALAVLGGGHVRRNALAAPARPNFDITPPTRDRRAWRWRATRWPRDGRTRWRSSTCACRPGWDGLETIEQLWAADPDVQVVICSAHTDYDWSEVVERLKHSDKLLVLRKPAEPIEVLQCATALSRKWQNERLVRDQVERLEQVITLRTRGLEAANRQLRHLATHDALTGLPNRVLLDDRLEAGGGARRPRRPVVRAAGLRSRSLQARQRLAGTSRGRRAAAGGGAPPDRTGAAPSTRWRASAATSSSC